ncbi:MAG: pantoate--beta-alanine ligase [Gammaproteobacteria bacterium]
MKHPAVVIARTIGDLHKLRAALPVARKVEKIALVPTMGALHEGHLSLVRKARKFAGVVVVSIYVNPLQFGAGEDFADYPRGLARDCKMLAGLADIVFAPGDKQMYPQRQEITLSLPPLAAELCGHSRPGFFEGVAMAVCKLLNIVRPDYALFGKKDYQQWILMKLMARQLNTGAQIIAGRIVRESDGLAISSRNAYLNPSERKTAPLLYKTLQATAAAIQAHTGGKKERAKKRAQEYANKHAKECIAGAKAKLQAAGFVVDYIELRDATTLSPQPDKKAILLTAATIGKTRLLDNIELTIPD